MTLAPQLGGADLQRGVEIPMVVGGLRHAPGFLLIDVEVVVVAEHITLIQRVVFVQKVVVLHVLVLGEVAFGELIDI